MELIGTIAFHLSINATKRAISKLTAVLCALRKISFMEISATIRNGISTISNFSLKFYRFGTVVVWIRLAFVDSFSLSWLYLLLSFLRYKLKAVSLVI